MLVASTERRLPLEGPREGSLDTNGKSSGLNGAGPSPLKSSAGTFVRIMLDDPSDDGEDEPDGEDW